MQGSMQSGHRRIKSRSVPVFSVLAVGYACIPLAVAYTATPAASLEQQALPSSQGSWDQELPVSESAGAASLQTAAAAPQYAPIASTAGSPGVNKELSETARLAALQAELKITGLEAQLKKERLEAQLMQERLEAQLTRRWLV